MFSGGEGVRHRLFSACGRPGMCRPEPPSVRTWWPRCRGVTSTHRLQQSTRFGDGFCPRIPLFGGGPHPTMD